jgi:transketolase
VAEVLSEQRPTPLVRVGVHDVFGTSGDAEVLMAYFELTAEDIAGAAEGVLGAGS